jgi:hypothetical protein
MSKIRRITVLVSEEEYKTIKEKAGLIPLSTWMKANALSNLVMTLPPEQGPYEHSAPRAPQMERHPKSCQCRVCQFRRENLK